MNCVNCQTELEDFLYGELSEYRLAEIRAHLEVCSACSAVRDDLERENGIFAQFYEETALEPSAEMWKAVSARIGLQSAPSPRKETIGSWLAGRLNFGAPAWWSRPAVWRQAAFAMFLIALSVSVTVLFLKRSWPDEETLARKRGPAVASPTPLQEKASQAPHPAPVDQRIGAGSGQAKRETAPKPPVISRSANSAKHLTEEEILGRQIARAEREYRNAIKLLDLAIARRRSGLDPDLVKQYEESLALIDDSIAASRQAFRDRPGDLSAGQFLLTAYARKVELMQEIALR